MKRNTHDLVGYALTGAMLLTTSLANAAGPVDLTNTQMEAVSAGVQTSTSAATASARFGFAATNSQTYANKTGSVVITSSTSSGVAGGTGAGAGATARTVVR